MFPPHNGQLDYIADIYESLSPEIKYVSFTHDNFNANQKPYTMIDLSEYISGNVPRDSGKPMMRVPVVTLPGSDVPGFILRPFQEWHNPLENIEVYNRPVYVKPQRYIVLPLLMKYMEQELWEYNPLDWSGESTVAGTTIYDYFKLTCKIGINYCAQPKLRYHFNLRKDIDPVSVDGDQEAIYTPIFYYPYNDCADENVADKRRPVKITQQFIAAPAAVLYIRSWSKFGVNIESRLVALNAAQELNDRLPDGKYFQLSLHVDGATSVINDETNIYVG